MNRKIKITKITVRRKKERSLIEKLRIDKRNYILFFLNEKEEGEIRKRF
jgi:hypothetical protein